MAKKPGSYMEHRPADVRHSTGETVCKLCGQIWPCQVAEWEVEGARLAAEVARLEAALRAVEITAMRLRSDANVAKDLGYEGGDEAATADELMAIVKPALSGAGRGGE